MKIFVAGATGVLGRRAVKLLVDDGHAVSAVSRSPDKARRIEADGATAVSVDIFDADALRAAVAGHDVVMNLATHIPTTSKMAFAGAWKENDRIRTEGVRNLVDAAIAAKAKRYVQESIGFTYRDGGGDWLDEETPLDLAKHTASTADAEAHTARFTEHGGIGVVLRFGEFYGPDSDQTRMQVKLARRGISPFFGSVDEFVPVVHLDDAATAVVAALRAPAGIYHVTDNEPLTKGAAAEALASAVGARKHRSVPKPLLAMSGSVVRLLMRSQRVSNERFRKATGWSPAYPSIREGARALVDQINRADAPAGSRSTA